MRRGVSVLFLSIFLFCGGGAAAQDMRGYLFFPTGATTTTGSAGSTVHGYGGGGQKVAASHFELAAR